MSTVLTDFIAELKQRNNIVTVVGRYIPLQKKGNNYWGRCPFHLEKTPSFSVNEMDQFYHCFGCKAGGDVIKFVSEMESISYMDAIKLLAEESNLKVPNAYEEDENYEEKKRQREEMVRCMKDCAKHYHENLKQSPKAREYLERRGITNEMITKFGIGYSAGFQKSIDYLKTKGYSESLIKEVGIAKEKDGRVYDAIGDRIAFPVINIYGDVVAFSGRTMDKDATYAKYLNTAETPIFSKSKNLFGINLVKKTKQTAGLKEIIIVEGQIDVIAMHQAGYGNALASLGTALTVEQARAIKRLSDNVIICYDGDFAGTKATLRGLDILKQESLNVRVASLPEGMDPDEVIKSKGKEFFDRIISNALPLIEFKLKYLKSQFNLNEFDGKAKYIEEAMGVLAGLGEIEAEVYLDYIKELTSVNKEFLQNKLRKDSSLKLNTSNVIKQAQIRREEKKDNIFVQSVYCVLANILRDKGYIKLPNGFGINLDERFSDMLSFVKIEKSVAKFIDKFEEEFAEEVGEIVNFNFEEDDQINSEQFRDCLWVVYKNGLEEEKQKLIDKLDEAGETEKREIMAKIMQISQKINNRSME